MRIDPANTSCLIVDMQERLMPAMYNEASCMERSIMLLKGMQILEIPTIISQQYTKGLGMSLPQIYEAAGTTEYLDKKSFSCYMDEGIKNAIDTLGKKNIIILGAETHVCVLQTCLDLKEAGYNPILVLDCVASRKEYDREIGIQRAIQEGITVTTAEAILFELTVGAFHPKFKEISKLVK